MLEVSLPFYRQRTCAMPLESELLTKESLEHGKAPSWKDLPESIGNWNLCGVNRVELLGKRPELAERPHIFRRNIFGETVDDRRCGPVPDLPADRGAVVSTETNGGAVIVKLVESQVVALTDCDHHLGEQRRPISVKQPIQSASEPIVAEVLHLLGRDAEHPAGEDLNRLLLPIDRLSFDNNRAQQHTQRTAVWDGAAGVGANVPIDQIFQAKALDEMIDDRQGTQALALQGAAGHFACFQANQSLRVVIVGRRESSAVAIQARAACPLSQSDAPQVPCHVDQSRSSSKRTSGSLVFEPLSTLWTTSLPGRFCSV